MSEQDSDGICYKPQQPACCETRHMLLQFVVVYNSLMVYLE